MPITEKQRQRRVNYIGSSDSAAILGMNPYKTSKDIWIEKVFPLEPSKINENMARGNYLEPALLKFAAEETGYKIAQNQFRSKGIMSANLDGQAFKDIVDNEYHIRKRIFQPIGFEAKSSVLTEGWGEPGTDEVPTYVIIQCIHQMYVADLSTVYVPRIAPYSLRLELFVIERNPEIEESITRMVDYLEKWFRIHVIEGIEPKSNISPNIELLKRIKRTPNTFANSIDETLITEWEKAKSQKSEWDKKEEEIKAAILLSLGENEACRLSNGGLIQFLEENNGMNIDIKTFKLKYPEIYNELTSPKTRKVLRIKKG